MADATLQTELWLIEPATHPDDQMWQDRSVWAEVVVAAQTPAFARLAAERHALSSPWIPVGNGSESRRAGFNDEQLYHVRALPPDRRTGFSGPVRDGDILLMRQLRPARRP
jgi:hypothetical protein